jgi:hypothetical protein
MRSLMGGQRTINHVSLSLEKNEGLLNIRLGPCMFRRCREDRCGCEGRP